MKLNQIVLEAPEFGEGRVSDNRPIDIAQLSEQVSHDMEKQDELLRAFSTRLRKDMLEIAMSTGKKQVQFVKDFQSAAEEICAPELVKQAADFIAKPKDAAKLAKLTQSMVATSIFVSSLRRI